MSQASETLNTTDLQPQNTNLVGKRVFGVQASAIFETLVFLTVIILLSHWLGKGDRFIGVSPHPFWIPLLLIVVQYGTVAGLVCAAMCTFTLLFLNMPAMTFDENIYGYFLRVSLQPTLWFVAAVFLGELRMRHINEHREALENLQDAQEKEKTIAYSYRRLKEIKEAMETHMASQYHGSITTFHAMRSIKSLNPIEILYGIGDAVVEVMNPAKFSVYALGDNGFEVVSNQGWTESDPYMIRITDDHPLYRELIAGKRIISVINETDRKILSNQGVIAGPLIDPTTEEIFGMIKIESLELKSITMRNIEIFNVLCQSAGIAYAQAKEFKAMKDAAMVDGPTGLYTYSFFTLQKRLCKTLEEKFGLHFFTIDIDLANKRDFSLKDRETLAQALVKIAKKVVGKDALLFADRKSDTTFTLLIPAKHPQRADYVVSQFHDVLAETKNKAIETAILTFKAKPLN